MCGAVVVLKVVVGCGGGVEVSCGGVMLVKVLMEW